MKPEKRYLPLDLSSERDLLKLILEEVKAAKQEAGRQDKVKTKPGKYRKLAELIDSVFFVLYLITFVIFLVSMCEVWVPKSEAD